MIAIVQPRRRALPESALLALLCLIDLIVTLWIVESGQGVEANPVMRFYYDISPMAFAVAKSLLCVVPILFLEGLYERNPRFIRALLRAGSAGYVAVYLLGILTVNHLM